MKRFIICGKNSFVGQLNCNSFEEFRLIPVVTSKRFPGTARLYPPPL
ncbi:hypothetical protein [Arthrobacter cupressi]|nr:hypothetical protein [Arthrobacter cupressi]NYD77629.1 hypothetical protein [Arthrobacter cupressi]